MDGSTENGHVPHKPNVNALLPWLDLKVFYVRVIKCETDESTPEYLTLNHIPLDPETLLEVNGVRASIYSDGEKTVLRRDRLDKKSEEVTFVSTDNIRITGSVKFEVFDKNALVLSGVLELINSDGFSGETNPESQRWNMHCESSVVLGTGFLKGKSGLPTIEVYIAGSFGGTPIILTKTLQFNSRKKHSRKSLLDSIPESDATEDRKETSSELTLREVEYPLYKPESEEYGIYQETGYMENEDGEITWFNAGVRVGVGIGLSICLGVGLGIGLLVKTYQGTTRNFRRRLL